MNDNLRVLVVDDHRLARHVIRKMLVDLRIGIETEEAEDGEIAWQRLTQALEKRNDLRQRPFDILIADINMPRLDGLGLARRCSESKQLRSLSYIIVTGNNDTKYIGAAAELGAAGYIVKPFSFSTFQRTFKQLLVRREDIVETELRKIEHAIADGAIEGALSTLRDLKRSSRLLHPKLIALEARALMEMGRYAESEKCLETALGSSSRHISPLKAYAALKLKLGKPKEALEALEQLASINPFDTDRNITLGNLYMEYDRKKDGVRILTDTARMQIDYEKRVKIAEILQNNEFYDEALRIHARNVRETPLSIQAAETWNRVGIKLRQDGKFEQAERFYKLVLSYYPKSTVVLYNIGVLYLAWNDRKSEACRYFSRALEVDPSFKPARDMYVKHSNTKVMWRS